VCGQCLAAFNGPGITDGARRVAVVPTTHQIVLPSHDAASIDIDVNRLVPGQKRRNYSNKAIITSTKYLITGNKLR